MPIAADESIRKADDPLAVVRARAADIAVLKVAPLGGVSALLDIAAQIDIPVVVSSALDSAVGIAGAGRRRGAAATRPCLRAGHRRAVRRRRRRDRRAGRRLPAGRAGDTRPGAAAGAGRVAAAPAVVDRPGQGLLSAACTVVRVTNLAYDDRGTGEPVVFIAGRGGAGRTWRPHQVPAFLAAGYRCITFDNRGIGATENAEGFTTQTMVADTAALIESLGVAPARIVGVSMGSYIAQELMVARPELVTAAVADGHPRPAGPRPASPSAMPRPSSTPPACSCHPPTKTKSRLLESFSRKTLNDDTAVADWIEMFDMWPIKSTPGLRCQLDVAPQTNRLPAYRNIATPVLVIGFADDVVTPPHLGREVADALPKGRYLQIPDAGHLGFFERPEAVNAAVAAVLRQHQGLSSPPRRTGHAPHESRRPLIAICPPQSDNFRISLVVAQRRAIRLSPDGEAAVAHVTRHLCVLTAVTPCRSEPLDDTGSRRR